MLSLVKIQKKLEAMGGKVGNAVHSTTTALVSDKGKK